MRFRGLLAAVAVLAVLGGLSYWSEKKKKADEGKPAADAPPKILSVPEDQVKEIRVKKAGETTVVKKSDAGKWQITEPKPLPADQDSVSSVVSALTSLSSDRLVEDKAANLAEYGLTTPAVEVVLTKKDGKTEKLLLGEETPTGGGVFAKLENDPRVFTVASYVKSSLDKSSQDLRDRRLLTFDSDKLTRVELQAKGQAIEFGKNNQNEWQILKPGPMRADGSQVEDLVRRLRDAKMETAITPEDAKKAASGFASGARVAMANVADAGGSQQIEVRKDKEKNYYAKSTVVEGIYKIPSDVGEGLDKGLADFRNKKLFDFGWNDPSKLEVRPASGAATTYQKSGEKWMSGSKEMDSASIQAVIDKLRDLSAAKFVETGGGTPVLDVSVTSNNSKRVEKVSITKQDAAYLAKRENEPSIYEVDGKNVEELQKAINEIKASEPAKNEKK